MPGNAESAKKPTTRHGSDPLVFAALQWPALVGLLAPAHSLWAAAAKVLLALWLLALQSAAFRGRYQRLPAFGFSVLMNNALFVGFWLAHRPMARWIWGGLLFFFMLSSIGLARKIPCAENSSDL